MEKRPIRVRVLSGYHDLVIDRIFKCETLNVKNPDFLRHFLIELRYSHEREISKSFCFKANQVMNQAVAALPDSCVENLVNAYMRLECEEHCQQ